MQNIMLDLETMGTGPDASIAAIGAVEFSQAGLGREFYAPINWLSIAGDGFSMDLDTIRWWIGQSQEARTMITGEGREIETVLQAFSFWLAGAPGARIWGNGVDFDNVVLASAYRKKSLELPWEFWNNRCYRTVKSLFPRLKIERNGTHHNALDDAKSQAEHLIQIADITRLMIL